MTSHSRIIREESSLLVRHRWSNQHYDEKTRTPSEHCEAIGFVVTTYNGLELLFRLLVGMVAGLKGPRTDALLTHVGSVTLAQALRSLAPLVTSDQEIRDELEFCAKLFDRHRINRNFIVHNSTYSPMAIVGEDYTHFVKRSAKGTLKTEHWAIPLSVLRRTADQNMDCHEYLSRAVGPLCHAAADQTITLPCRPEVPTELARLHPQTDLATLAGFPNSKPSEDED